MEGNQMKMREALENIAGYAETARCHTEDVHILSFLGEIEGWARSALSAPQRQCDVGTADEQSDRFAIFCDSHSRCSQCPVKSLWNFANDHKPSCGFLWSQTPYEAEEGGAE